MVFASQKSQLVQLSITVFYNNLKIFFNYLGKKLIYLTSYVRRQPKVDKCG
jgi:uncharacterized membrane protein YGL010W